MSTQIKWVDAPARALMSLIFILSGIGKIGATAPLRSNHFPCK
jgi:hypothetical protein